MVLADSGVVLWHTSMVSAMGSVFLFSVVVVLGVLVNQKGRLARLPRFGVTGLHRYLSLLAAALVAVHVVTTVTDQSSGVGVAAVFVPFVAQDETLLIGLGAAAVDLFAVVIITSAIRQRIGHRTWQAIHWTVYLAWPAALFHGFRLGTDLDSGWLLALTWVCVIGFGLALGWRLIAAALSVPRGRRVAAMFRSIRPAAVPPRSEPGTGPARRAGPQVAVPPARPPPSPRRGGVPASARPASPDAAPPPAGEPDSRP